MLLKWKTKQNNPPTPYLLSSRIHLSQLKLISLVMVISVVNKLSCPLVFPQTPEGTKKKSCFRSHTFKKDNRLIKYYQAEKERF